MNYNSEVVARNSHQVNIYQPINVGNAITRLNQYKTVLLGNHDDEISENVKNMATRYNKSSDAPMILNSIAVELSKCGSLLRKANRYQFEDWIHTALKYNFKFGSAEKRIHILEFNRQPIMYFGYEAYQDVVERLYNIRILIEVFSTKEVFSFYKYVHNIECPIKETSPLPECIPSNLRNKNIKSARDIFGFRVHLLDLKTSDVVKSIDLDVSEYLPDWYIEMTEHKPFWKKYPLSMAKKRVLIEYIKGHIGLKSDEFLEMMNFELDQEQRLGLSR